MITFREWHPVGVEEYGYAAPDPLNADIIYGGKVTRYDRRTGQVQNVAPTPVRPADFRTLRTAPVRLLPGRSARDVLRVEHAVEDGDRRPELAADQPGPDAQDLGGAGEHRQVPQRRDGEADAARRHLHGRAVAARRQPHLGRHRRRADPRDRRRRRDLARRHAAGPEAVHEGVDHRRRPLRRADRLRRDQHAAARRPAPAHLPHARRRQDLDGDRQRHPRRRAGQRGARGPEAQGPAVRRHRARGLRVVRRRRALAVAAAEHAGDVDPRRHRQRRRPRRRHARPRLLDPRRHHAAAADRRRSRAAAERLFCSSRRRRIACARTRTPTRRCRRTKPAGRIRPTARSSTTRWRRPRPVR